MAKRKRLEIPSDTIQPDIEMKSAFNMRARMPIAEVAGDTAGRAALEEVAREMTAAEEEGRVVKKLPIDSVRVDHLVRDRMDLDPEEMATLVASIRARGQKTPIEVVRTEGGFGLISGLRRLEALRAVGEDHVLALVRSPETSRSAYQAMVEENEIRSNLSFYERANIANAAVAAGVYDDIRSAIGGLFANTTPAKRSKIARFVILIEVLGKSLRFPTAIPEKLGLALAQAVETDAALATRIRDALRKTPPVDAATERRVLERSLAKRAGTGPAPRTETLAPGLKASFKDGRAIFSGAALTPEFCEALRAFAVSHAKREA